MAQETSIGAQMYTVRDFTKSTADIAKTMRRLREIGYRAVQTSALATDDAKEIRKMLDDSGLVCAATHVSPDRILKDTDWVVDHHKTLGCEHSAVGSMPGAYRTAEGFSRFAREFSKAAARLAANGITFSYHNHSFEFEKFGGKLGMDTLISESDAGVFFLELDTYWAQYGGADPAAWVRRLKGRIPLLHLKDMTVRGERGPIMTEVGEGNLNWPQILAAAREAGTKWYLVEQDTCERDPFDSLRISLENLNRMGLR